MKKLSAETPNYKTVCFELIIKQHSTKQTLQISFNLLQQTQTEKSISAHLHLESLPGPQSEDFEKPVSSNMDQMKCKNPTQRAKNIPLSKSSLST